MATIPKDFFLAHRSEIQYGGSILLRDSDGALIVVDGFGARRNPERVVYPDKDDKKLIEELIAVYKDIQWDRGTFRITSYDLAKIAPALFGMDWKAEMEAQLETATPEELRAKAAAFVAQIVSQMPATTADEVAVIIGRLDYAYSGERKAIGTLMEEWMTVGEYINLLESRMAVNEAVKAEQTRLQEVKRQLAAEAERTKSEALKSHPSYQEILADIAAKFEALGVTIFYNPEEVQVEGFKRRARSVYPAFNQIWMKDRAGKHGVVFRVKEILKNRFGAQFCGGVMRGDRKYGDATWHVPASTDLLALYELLS